MHVLLRTSTGRVIPVWINRPDMQIVVHRTDRGDAPELYLLSGVAGNGRLVYVPAVPLRSSS